MKISSLLIATLLFSGVLIGMSGFYSALGSEYSQTADNYNSTAMEQMNNVTDKITEMSDSLKPTEERNFISDLGYLFTAGLVNIIMIFLEIPSIIANSLTIATGNTLFIPAWLVTIIIGIVSIYIIIGVVNALRGSKSA